jgi:hypothetical protein
MKKIFLIFPFVLLSCSEDRNLDGQFTISDISLSFEGYIIGFGEPLFNTIAKTGIFKFLEIDVSAPNNSIIFFIGAIFFIFFIGLVWLFWQFTYETITNEFKDFFQTLQREKQFQKDNSLGIYEKCIRWVKKIIILITGLIWGGAFIWLFLIFAIWALTP